MGNVAGSKWFTTEGPKIEGEAAYDIWERDNPKEEKREVKSAQEVAAGFSDPHETDEEVESGRRNPYGSFQRSDGEGAVVDGGDAPDIGEVMERPNFTPMSGGVA